LWSYRAEGVIFFCSPEIRVLWCRVAAKARNNEASEFNVAMRNKNNEALREKLLCRKNGALKNIHSFTFLQNARSRPKQSTPLAAPDKIE